MKTGIIVLVLLVTIMAEPYGLIYLKNGQTNSGYITKATLNSIYIKGSKSLPSRAFPISFADIDSITTDQNKIESPITFEKVSEVLSEVPAYKIQDKVSAVGDSTSKSTAVLSKASPDLTDMRICPMCGMVNTRDSKFCRDCGYSFFASRLSKPMVERPAITNQTQNPKSPGVALALSLLLPGGGHYYNGNFGTGAAYTISTTAITLIAVNQARTARGEDAAPWIYITASVVHIIDIIHAAKNASEGKYPH